MPDLRRGIGARGRGISLRGRLNLLVALCVLPLLAVTLVTDYFAYRSARQQAAAQAEAFARSFADDVGRLLQSDIMALRTLALSPSLLRGDLTAFTGQANGFLAMQPPGSVLALADADRRIVMAFGVTLPQPPPLHTAADVQRRVFESGVPGVSGYYVGAMTHRGGFSVDVPVQVGGKVVWDIFLNPGFEGLATIAAQQRPMATWSLAVTDGAGVILGRWPNPDRFIGRHVAPDLLPAMRRARDGILPIVSLEGQNMLAVFAGVPGSDWQVEIGIPRGELDRPLRDGALTTMGIGAAFLALGLLLAGAVARGIIAPIARLQTLAQRADQDDAATLSPHPTGLAETDAVAGALHAAAVARADALARLRAFTDQLEQRVAQEVAARQEAQSRAAHGERMQALGRLASGVAHDFGNILQTVEAASNLLEHRADDAAAVRRLAKMLRSAGRQGGAVTGRLLGLARNAPPAPAPFAAAPLLDEMHDLLTATLTGQGDEKPVGLTIAAPADLPALLADRAQLETVLLNLAANARDAMPEGGTLTLTAAAERVETGTTAPSGLLPGAYVCLSIADTGSGMPPEVLARVTEPFFTTKPAGRGTGLGLALARGFAEQSGGALAIESAPGVGTVVRLWLPQAEAFSSVA